MSTNFLDCKYIAFYPLRKTSPCIFSEKSCLLAFFRTLGLNPYLCCSESVLFASEKHHYSANMQHQKKRELYIYFTHNRLVQSQQTRPPLAKYTKSVSHLDFGGDFATNSRSAGNGVLFSLHRAFPHHKIVG